MTTTAELPFLDVFSESFEWDGPEIAAARRVSPVARTPIGLAVLRYDDCAAALKDPRLHQGSSAILTMRGVTSGPLVEWWRTTVLNVDGPAHTRLRRLVAKAFTPPSVERLRPFFRATAERLAGAFPADGRVEFVSSFSEPYPLEGICEMLGIKPERRASFAGYAGDMALIFSNRIGQPETQAKATAGLLGLYACADEAIADRRLHPGDDLVSALIAAESEGDRLSEDELRGMVAGLVFAGNDTTRNQLALGMLAFARNPEQWAALHADPALAAPAVEEMMRAVPTIAVVPRIAQEAIEIGGVEVKKGFILTLIIESANADERVFADAGFDIRAERAAHLTFSGGVHRCLGMWLARAEMQEALGVLARFGRVELAGEPAWLPGLGIDGPTELPLRFSA